MDMSLSSESWWWTGKPVLLQSVESQESQTRLSDWTELNWSLTGKPFSLESSCDYILITSWKCGGGAFQIKTGEETPSRSFCLTFVWASPKHNIGKCSPEERTQSREAEGVSSVSDSDPWTGHFLHSVFLLCKGRFSKLTPRTLSVTSVISQGIVHTIVLYCPCHSPLHMYLVTQSCPTLCNPMDCRPPGSSVHGILQARILEWVAMPSSRGSSQPRD